LQSIILVYVLEYHEFGISIVSKYVFIIILIPVIINQWIILKQTPFRYQPNYKYFMFMGYIILSLVLPEFHPFSKYPMYNNFPNYAYVFLLRDSRNHFIPLNKNYSITGANLGHLYFSIRNLHHYNIKDNGERSEMDDSVGKEMFQYIKSKRYNKSCADSISVNKIFLHLKNGKITSNEIQLYKGKME
jgi:hypothetical protein